MSNLELLKDKILNYITLMKALEISSCTDKSINLILIGLIIWRKNLSLFILNL